MKYRHTELEVRTGDYILTKMNLAKSSRQTGTEYLLGFM